MSKTLEAIHSPPVGSKPVASKFLLGLPHEVKFASYAKRAHPCLSLFVLIKIRQFFRTSLSHKSSSKVVFSPRACFFPRVRTPCGHGAQVIIEGREKQSDGGEKDKDNPSKVYKKSTNGLRFSITSNQRPLHGVAKTWSRCRSRA